MKRFGKYRVLFTAAGILLLSALVFLLYWNLNVRDAQTKSYAIQLYESSDFELLPVETYQVVEQDFYWAKSPLSSIGVKPVFDAGRQLAGVFQLRLSDGAGEVLAVSSLDASEAVSGAYLVFPFADDVSSRDGRYRLELIADLDAEFSLVTGPGSDANWQLYTGGAPVERLLHLHADGERLGGFIARFYFIFAAASSAAAAGFYLLAKNKKLPLHKCYAIVALLLGVLFSVIFPPYSVPDEYAHINAAYNISSYWRGETDTPDAGDSTVRRADDRNDILSVHVTGQTYKEVARQLFTRSENDAPVRYDEWGVGGYLLCYYPAAAAVSLCRLLGFGFVPTLVLARLLNLLIYVFLTMLAVKFAPFAKGVFIAVGLLPMNMHIAPSFSRDVVMNGLFLLFFAYYLYLAHEKARICGKNLLILLLIAILALPAKMVYWPVVLIAVFLPRDKMFLFKKQVTPAQHRIFTSVSVAAVLTGAGIMLIRYFIPLTAGYQPPPPETSPEYVRYSLPYIAAHLTDTFWLVVRSVFDQMFHYLGSLAGGSLSYYNVGINTSYVIVCYLLLSLALIPEKGECRISAKESRAALILVLLSAAMVVGGCILWTPTYQTTIYGIQGRYFMPLLPPILYAVHRKIGRFEKGPGFDRTLMCAFGVLNIGVLLNSFLEILAR